MLQPGGKTGRRARSHRSVDRLAGALAAVLAVLLSLAPGVQASPSTLARAKRASSWRTEIARRAAGAQPAHARAAQQAASTSREILVVENGGDYGNPEPAEDAKLLLEELHYRVTLKAGLPNNLAPYEAIWYVGTNAIASAAQASLEGFVRAGGGLYLTGERPCCESLNQSDEAILDEVLNVPPFRVGDGSDVNSSSELENLVNPNAVNGVTQVPYRLATWHPSAPGVIPDLPEWNTVTYGYQGVFTAATGAAWDGSEIYRGHGNVVLMMDINWLESSWDSLPEAEKFVSDIERFLTGRPAPTGRYVALGDSYSSGDGNTPYEPENPERGCHRSSADAYPDFLAKDLDLKESSYAFNFVACSGNTTGEVRSSQLSALGPQTKLVTISVGGDDIDSLGVVTACVKFSIFHPFTSESCSSNASVPPEVRNAKHNIQALRGALETEYREIESRAPNAAGHIYVLGYPYLLPPASQITHGCSLLNEKSTIWLSEREVELDGVVAAAVKATGLKYVNPNASGKAYSFEGHGICQSSSQSWFHLITIHNLVASTPLHPNQEGQRRLAEAFAAAGATKTNVDAPALLAPGRRSALPTGRAGAPTSEPARAGAPAKAKSKTGAIKGKVTGPNKKPLAGVTVYAQSPELGFYASASTEAKGKYKITGIAGGTYKVEFYDPQYEAQWYEDKPSEAAATPIVIKAGRSAGGINARLASYASISGTVKSAAGAPVDYARVSVTNLEGDTLASAETNMAGAYTVSALQAGTYKVQFTPENFGEGEYLESQWYNDEPSVRNATVVTLAASENAANINAVLAPAASVSGVVKSSEGQALSGVEVLVEGLEGGAQYYAYSGEGGAYTVHGIPAGAYRVEFVGDGLAYADQWYDGKTRADEATSITLSSGQKLEGIDAALQPDAAIAGKVTATSGRPLAGVEVVAVALEGGAQTTAATEGDGTYTLSGLTPGEYKVTFEPGAKHFAEQWYSGAASESDASVLTLAPGEQRAGIDAQLQATAASIEGTVRDSSGAVSGVQVIASSPGGEQAGTALSASDGSYVIEGLAPGSYTVQFEAEEAGDVSQYYDGVEQLSEATSIALTEDQEAQGIDATLKRGAVISGAVTAAGGSPLSGVQVEITDSAGDFVAAGVTESDGSYTISGLPPGTYLAQFEPLGSDYVGQYFDGANSAEAAQPITLSAGDVREGVDAELAPGAGITGTVSDAASGEGISDVEVSAISSEGADAGHARTTSSGAYTISGLTPGKYTVEFEPTQSKYVGQYYEDAAGAESARVLTLAGGETKEGVNAALTVGASISGQVTSAQTHEAAAGVKVHVTDSENGVAINTSTGENGTYTAQGLPAGSYTVQFEPSGAGEVAQFYPDASTVEDAQAVNVTEGEAEEGINAELAAAASITGTVTDATSGQPLAGVEVEATSSEAGATGSALTGEDGSYTISGLPEGTYTVQFEPSDQEHVSVFYEQASSVETAKPVSVTAGATSAGIDAALGAGASISGTVTDAHSGKPVAGVSVNVSSGETGASASAQTGSSGEYTVSGLPAGSYTVQFEANGSNYVSQYYEGASTPESASAVTVSSGAHRTGVDAALAAGASISGSVTQAHTGEPLEGIEVFAYTSGCNSSGGAATTDSQGAYEIAGLPAGNYHVVFNPDGGDYESSQFSQTLTLAEGASDTGIDGSLAFLSESEWAPAIECEEP